MQFCLHAILGLQKFYATSISSQVWVRLVKVGEPIEFAVVKISPVHTIHPSAHSMLCEEKVKPFRFKKMTEENITFWFWLG